MDQAKPLDTNKAQKRLIIVSLVINILFALGLVAVFLMWLNSSRQVSNLENQVKTLQDQAPVSYSVEDDKEEVSETPTPTPTPTPAPVPPVDNGPIKTFTDDQIPGFSFKYDSTKWDIEAVEDLKFCNDVQCGPSEGRSYRLVSKITTSGMDRQALGITLSAVATPDAYYADNQICFPPANITKFSNAWYRASSPYDNVNPPMGNYSFYFYPNNAVTNNCIKGSLNIYVQDVIPNISYQGRPVKFDIYYSNNISESLNADADEIVNSIRY